MAATIEHYRAYNAAAAANGIMAYLPARYANMHSVCPNRFKRLPKLQLLVALIWQLTLSPSPEFQKLFHHLQWP
jgi:hypothetical protein